MAKFVLAGCLLVVGAVAAALPGTQPSDVKFEVVSVKIMSDEESRKIAGPDYIGADVLVRFRLSASSRDISYYAFQFNKEPIGHQIVWSSDGKMRIYPVGANEAKEVSPGIVDLRRFGLPTAWLHLDAGKNIEFEGLDGTGSAGEKHGKSAFVRFLPDEKPIEIFSPPYLVPAGARTKP